MYWRDGRKTYGESGHFSSAVNGAGVILGIKLCGDLCRLQLDPP